MLCSPLGAITFYREAKTWTDLLKLLAIRGEDETGGWENCSLLLRCCFRDLQADWNSRVRSRHVILPPGRGQQPALEPATPGSLSVRCGGSTGSSRTHSHGGISFRGAGHAFCSE
ncbi:hypothetical protein EYF80_044322 [Liparis tanakae]|uniref:Uncharacterized protein n=1 Tax=Liparis tanakae TaxID=230148 RepID=A0A4Z2FXJ5_9TELE|nr:hypothetical protein EYF80_044322 [Liparis tanakae]